MAVHGEHYIKVERRVKVTTSTCVPHILKEGRKEEKRKEEKRHKGRKETNTERRQVRQVQIVLHKTRARITAP